MASEEPAPSEVDRLIGRDVELRVLSEALLPATGAPRPVAITGPGGIGKTALVKAFAAQHVDRFPGGYVRLPTLTVQADDRALVAAVAASLGIAPSIEEKEDAVRKRLLAPAALLHVEDVDSRAMTLAVAALMRRLRGVAAVVSGRFEALGAGLDWTSIRLGPLGADAALRLLVAEEGAAAGGGDGGRQALADALGGVPLALRLGGRLLRAGETAAELMAAIDARRPASDEVPPSSGRRLRRVLEAEIARALGQLGARLGDRAEALLAGWRFFVHAPLGGVGKHLGAALAGLAAEDFVRLMAEAEALGLVAGAGRWRLHPVVAESARREEEKEGALGRITAWFIERLAEPREGWAQVLGETETLIWWLEVVPAGDWTEVVRAGTEYAKTNGPFASWMDFCERALASTQDESQRSALLWLLANVAQDTGDLERASVAAEEMRELATRTGSEHDLAAAWSILADVYAARGQTGEAVRILQQEVLPGLGEERERVAVFMKLGQLLELSSALSTLEEISESLRIHETAILPVIERMGQVGEKAAVLFTMGTLLLALGEYDRSLDALRKSVELGDGAGDARLWLHIRTYLGRALRCRGGRGDSDEALDVLDQALADARRRHSTRAIYLQRLIQTPTIERVVIRGFKNIEELTIPLTHASDLPGQWTCIAGINGAGKSAILQAIALILLGDERAADVGSTWLERMRRRTGDKIHETEIRATLRMGRERHEIALYIGERGIDRERLEKEPAYPKMRAIWLERETDHLLLSYGPGRNLSEHDDGRHNAKAEEVRRQMTLFDPLTQVASVEALLGAGGDTKIVWLLLRRLLTRVLEGTDLALDPERSSLRFRISGATVLPVDLPDGFRATIALLADLCAAWQKKAPDEAKSGDPSRIRAIVLVDEIDLHLHAGLQRSLVPNLRRALPEVQWIVTTHSPLVLGSFDKSEIVALEADPEHGVRLRPPLDRQILGFTVNEIYDWLMNVKPQSTALKAHFSGPEAHAKKTLILAQSPTVSEEEALANRDYRRTLAARKRPS